MSTDFVQLRAYMLERQARVRAGRMPSIKQRFPHIGKGICKVCRGRTKAGVYCSVACHERAYAYHGWSSMREYIYRRDSGKCAVCGCDLLKLRRVLAAVKSAHIIRLELGFRSSGALFDTDHIIPVIDGGDYEPENLRTLCTPCHKLETAALAGKRAMNRRESKHTLFKAGGTEVGR